MGDILLIGQSLAQIALQGVAKPVEIACRSALVQAQGFAQVGQRFSRGRLPKNRLRRIARQHLDPKEDHD